MGIQDGGLNWKDMARRELAYQMIDPSVINPGAVKLERWGPP